MFKTLFWAGSFLYAAIKLQPQPSGFAFLMLLWTLPVVAIAVSHVALGKRRSITLD